MTLRLPALFGLAAASLMLPGSVAAADNPAEAVELQRVEVIGTTPLPGLGTPLADVPANVQVFGAGDLRRQRQGNVAAFLEGQPTSVSANAAQGNPYQLDIAFRGFTASPLLGVPQGLSVFQDGVRINEPFGDVVNWDLLPQSAIASIQLIPGSNPLFGLNTLGGALAVYTKSGTAYPGTAVEVSGGSFGRRTLQVEHGGAQGAWDWFVTGHVANERGWAEHNPSRVRQLFAKVGHQTERSDFDVSLTLADNRLEGTQTLPASFLDDRRQAYTFPDTNENRVAMLAAKGSRFLDEGVLLGGNAYVRRYRNRNVSSNVNDDFGELDDDTGTVDDVQAFNDRAVLDQTSWGGGVQLTLERPLAGHRNQFVVGASGDFGRARFTQSVQTAAFTPSRAAVATGEFEPDTAAATRNRTLALFAQDSFALTPHWTLTASGRYNEARVRIRDRSGDAPELDGDHAFRRFNPALGINFKPASDLTTYASYSEGLRAPTAIELTCADPAAPCRLPNSFLADPPLKAVVSKTVELGARGGSGDTRWSVAVYRSTLDDDIQFVSSGGGLNAGFFQNVGRTLRRGVELTGSTRVGPLGLAARYGIVDARYETGFVEHSVNNRSADAQGDIVVPSGARLPGIPRQTLRVRADLALPAGWEVGASVLASSRVRARGDENHADPQGRVAGYAVLNLDARWTVVPGIELFARVDNVTERRYANFAVLGRNVFTGPQRGFDPATGRSEPFYGLGAPRGAWVGLRTEWK